MNDHFRIVKVFCPNHFPAGNIRGTYESQVHTQRMSNLGGLRPMRALDFYRDPLRVSELTVDRFLFDECRGVIPYPDSKSIQGPFGKG